MNEHELKGLMVDRILAAQTPWGRFRMTCYIHWKRGAWKGAIGTTLAVKRLVDVVISAVALIVLAPVFAILAILVKLDGGPVFFRQTRVGLLGREFKMIKYRSMVVDAEAKLKELLAKNEKASGVTFKMKNDPRITPVGRILRKTSLDELPQFLNVLRGEMSLVGPRPPTPREVALYSQADRRRFLVKPGITCLWQVGEREGRTFEIGDRNQIDFPEQVALDVRYIESQSLLKDLWIIAKTVPAILFGKGM
jgi:lipopolysaccharide/colanic/teichoic acid biosynthesis glycosyltransferase